MNQPDPKYFSAYNKKLQALAKKLKKTMTKAEACLWKYVLKGGKMKGYAFRRQRPVINFIADFMCIELKLIIEVDGYSHLLDEGFDNDQYKNEMLCQAGFYVLRFCDEEVLKNINQVIRVIECFIDEREKGEISAPYFKQNPPPAPSKGG